MHVLALERFGILFWLAVAVLASRVLLELGRILARVGHGVMNALRLAGRILATGSARPEVIMLVPTVHKDEPADAQPGEPQPVAPQVVEPAPNLLEEMSHDEMDNLLKKWA